MMALRIASWLFSTVFHVVLVVAFLDRAGGTALESGTGDVLLRVEQGVALEGFMKLGESEATVEEVDAPQTQLSEARPQIDEVEATEPVEEPPDVEAAELPEDTEVVTSKEGPEQEAIRPKEPERKELEQPRPPQMATLEQVEEVAVKEEQSSGAEQKGGDTTVHTAYLGKLRSHLERYKVNPRSRLTGTVVLRFTVDSTGQVLSREVTSSSGSVVLDDAAVAALDRASPFPPFPDGVVRGSLVVSVPFKFITR